MKTLEFNRRWSLFAPAFTYGVMDLVTNTNIGEVARNENDRRKWWASNKTWAGGGDLVQTFTTRHEAATALRHIADGTATPDTYGGYYVAPPPTCRYCENPLVLGDDGEWREDTTYEHTTAEQSADMARQCGLAPKGRHRT